MPLSSGSGRRRVSCFSTSLAVAAALGLLAGCHADAPASQPPPRATGARVAAPPAVSPAAPREGDTERPAPGAGDPVVVVVDPPLLRALEADGFTAGSVLAGGSGDSTNSLVGAPGYSALVDTITGDLAAARRADPAAGVGMRFAHRQFDPRWLVSKDTRFELVGVVNRLDRRPFAAGSCGEVRFVYRLAYRVATRAGQMDSRLPMTLNVVSYQPQAKDGTCGDAARSWVRPAGVRERGQEAAWLVSESGPLPRARRAGFTPKSVEVDLQSVRWPSTVRPAMAGHAEYVLRVFRRVPAPPYLVPAALENTVDVARVAAQPELRKDLERWLTTPEALAAIDAGTPLLPARFLAERAVSVSPHGFARRANRLYRQVFDPKVFASVDFTPYATLKTPEGFVRRLDGLTCPGCHQSRSIAGFHLLGVEPKEDTVDAVEVPMSPHLHAEMDRRRAVVAAIAEGRTPDERRPSAEHGPHDDGVGARCGLGNAAYADFLCAAGLRCVRHFDEELGECEPESGPGPGDSCESGSITAAGDPHRDTARLDARTACPGAGYCETNGVGFPGGMCSSGCDALPPGATCGGIAVLTEFNGCLAAGTPFDRCVAEHTRPGALRSCGFHAPCRDDYVCARGPGGGVCMPPYFLFQLRVDGHPL